MAGKGSNPRPVRISRKEYDNRFDRIFRKESNRKGTVEKSCKEQEEK